MCCMNTTRNPLVLLPDVYLIIYIKTVMEVFG